MHSIYLQDSETLFFLQKRLYEIQLRRWSSERIPKEIHAVVGIGRNGTPREVAQNNLLQQEHQSR